MTNTTDVTFRPAGPEDGEASAPLIHAAGPEAFDYIFHTARTDAFGFLRNALPRREGEFGHGIHVVGVRNGRIVACGAGWAGAGGAGLLHATALSILRYMGLRDTPGAFRRGLQVHSLMPDAGPGEYYIGHLGVDPAQRGRGIGAAMLAYLMAPVRTGRAHTAVLDVSMENPRAQALYERLGFRVTKTRDWTFENARARVPGHRRMSMAIAP
jgi:ribosomal protein S18 acetylase RimI-like enzyme